MDRERTRTCIETGTFVVNPVWVPMSCCMRRKVLGEKEKEIERAHGSVGATHKYAGGSVVRMLKKRMTRHESRSPRPYTTGPSVPVENLEVHGAEYGEH